MRTAPDLADLLQRSGRNLAIKYCHINMATVKFTLNDFPLATSLGGISWLQELRGAQSGSELTVADGTRAGLLERRAALSETLDDYCLYFLTSRARVRLAPRCDWRMKYFSDPYQDAAGSMCYDLQLVVDVPRGFDVHEAHATLSIGPELEDLLRPHRSAPTSKIVGLMMPAEADFSNALSFVFAGLDGTHVSISTNITPGLTRFISIKEPCPQEFMRFLAYDIHYIGQTSTQIEKRLHAHEKVRLFADKLLTKQLDQEPVVFAYTFHCDVNLDPTLALDLLEAALISHFKPALNIDKREFPKGDSLTEKSLRSRITTASLDRIEVAAIGSMYFTPLIKTKFLADGFGFTRDEYGRPRSISNEGFGIDLS